MDAIEAPTPRITRFQVFALIALACLNMQDGFDILAISFAATAITQDWDLSNSALGIVLSASLFGMMIGAMALSPLADRIGRKSVAVLGLILSGVGMLIAAFASSIDMLLIAKAITGPSGGGKTTLMKFIMGLFEPRLRMR